MTFTKLAICGKHRYGCSLSLCKSVLSGDQCLGDYGRTHTENTDK